MLRCCQKNPVQKNEATKNNVRYSKEQHNDGRNGVGREPGFVDLIHRRGECCPCAGRAGPMQVATRLLVHSLGTAVSEVAHICGGQKIGIEHCCKLVRKDIKWQILVLSFPCTTSEHGRRIQEPFFHNRNLWSLEWDGRRSHLGYGTCNVAVPGRSRALDN